ncbi:MAG: toprim domain-containing protein, partial [Bacteroidota bacterium]
MTVNAKVGRISKEAILDRCSALEIFEFYLRQARPNIQLRPGKNFQNPFLGREQRTPSFNIYKTRTGDWRFKDFSSSSENKGDCFEFVMQMYGEGFPDALERIAQDFSIHGAGTAPKLENKRQFDVSKRVTMTDAERQFWSAYGIGTDTLRLLNVFALENFRYQYDSGKRFAVTSQANRPIFAYQIGPDCYKLYQPFSDRKFKFSWLGEKPAEYVFGMAGLPESGKVILLTGGEKDVLTLQSHGFPAICLNSETAHPSKELTDDLKARFEHVIVLYDLDETGTKCSIEIAQKFGLCRAELPAELRKEKHGKDVSDFFKCMYADAPPSFATYETFDRVIQKAIENGKEKPSIDRKSPLGKMLEVSEKVHRIMQGTIEFPPPILRINEQPIIFSNTINVIQPSTERSTDFSSRAGCGSSPRTSGAS